MIYYYKHRSITDLSQTELDLLGYQGVYQYAYEHDISPTLLFNEIKKLEADIQAMGNQPFDMSQGSNLQLMNNCVDQYIQFFNKYAKHNKQAYIILGNIGSGKSTYAQEIEESTGSIIIDPDFYKMGAHTDRGYFEGFTSLYKTPTDRERLQEPCGEACKRTLLNVADLGMNLILPKATTSYEKLQKQLQVLTDRNYDIHLILFESPIKDCANRSYYRYLIREYDKTAAPGTSHGRFVPVSVITNIGDGTFTTFAKAYKDGRYKSYKAFFNKGTVGLDTSKYVNEEIDINSMFLDFGQ